MEGTFVFLSNEYFELWKLTDKKKKRQLIIRDIQSDKGKVNLSENDIMPKSSMGEVITVLYDGLGCTVCQFIMEGCVHHNEPE